MDIHAIPIADNPRLEEMAIEVMAALQKHNADLGEALDIFTNALVGVLVQYPKEVHESVIESIVYVLKEGSKSGQSDITDYSDRVKQKLRPN